MIFERISVNGFRSLVNIDIPLEKDLTVIVGENDCGKSTLIDAIKVLTDSQSLDLDDISRGESGAKFTLYTDEFTVYKEFKVTDSNGEKRIDDLGLKYRPSDEILEAIKKHLGEDDFDPEVDENRQFLMKTGRDFGLTVRANSNMDNLRQNIIESIDILIAEPGEWLEAKSLPEISKVELDGKKFENVPSFFKEVFLRERQASIWKEEIEKGKTVENFIHSKIEEYSKEITESLEKTGIKEKLQLFLSGLTDIIIEPIYESRDLNIDAKVKFLENGNEINLDKKGDGTKRRITMALLEIRKDQTKESPDSSTIYMFDEPDTHLHVKAQIELMDLLQSFIDNGDQVILTTHSPFIMNYARPQQIRLLEKGEAAFSKLKHLKEDAVSTSDILRELGIENVYLFFARTIIIVEGETEQQFLENHYMQRNGKALSSNLVRIVNVEGITNIYGFSRGILELHNKENIITMYDNDASDELRNLIHSLEIESNQHYVIGTKEFEDAFSNDVLFYCWKAYYDQNEWKCPEGWSAENIQKVREECDKNSKMKFSKEIKKLNRRGKKMTKPLFGTFLGKNLDKEDIPDRLRELFTTIEN